MKIIPPERRCKMNIAVDIILALLIVLIVYIYTKCGCKTVLHFATPIVAFVSAYIFGGKVGELLFEKPTLSYISNIVKDVLKSLLKEGESGLNISEIFERFPDEYSKMFARLGANFESIKSVFGNATFSTEQDFAKLSEEIATPLAESLSSILGSIAVFIAALILMFIITKIMELVVKLPVLKQANKLLGFVLGIISAFVYIWGLCLIFSFIVESGLAGEYNDKIKAIFEGSYIFRFFCNLSLMDFINIKF